MSDVRCCVVRCDMNLAKRFIYPMAKWSDGKLGRMPADNRHRTSDILGDDDPARFLGVLSPTMSVVRWRVVRCVMYLAKPPNDPLTHFSTQFLPCLYMEWQARPPASRACSRRRGGEFLSYAALSSAVSISSHSESPLHRRQRGKLASFERNTSSLQQLEEYNPGSTTS
jgi:hypothetical protein